MMEPRWSRNCIKCPRCVFIGQLDMYDVYCCPVELYSKYGKQIPHGANEFDTRMVSNYTGTDYTIADYTVVMVELVDAPKEFRAWVKIRS